MNGLFYIRNETFSIERGKIIHKFEACGDIGWAIEIQYIKIQCIVDGWKR
jgi:hypothetical protein